MNRENLPVFFNETEFEAQLLLCAPVFWFLPRQSDNIMHLNLILLFKWFLPSTNTM